MTSQSTFRVPKGVSILSDPTNEHVVHMRITYEQEIEPLDSFEKTLLHDFPTVLMDIGIAKMVYQIFKRLVARTTTYLLRSKTISREDQEEEKLLGDFIVALISSERSKATFKQYVVFLYIILVQMIKTLSIFPFLSARRLTQRFQGGLAECRTRSCGLNR